MALAELDSIRTVGNIDYTDMMERFSRWCMHGEYTPFGEVFDIGMATSRALMNYAKGMAPLESGGKTEWDNGNGSLMRILLILSILVDTFISKISFPMQPGPEIGSISDA